MIIKDRKSLRITGNAKLAQMGEHQTELQKSQVQYPLEVTILMIYFCFPHISLQCQYCQICLITKNLESVRER